MSLLIFLGLTPVFAVRFAHSMASFAGLPGSGGLLYPSNCGKLLGIEVMQYPPLPGSGVGLPPQQEFEGGALNGTPSNSCFLCSILIRYQY